MTERPASLLVRKRSSPPDALRRSGCLQLDREVQIGSLVCGSCITGDGSEGNLDYDYESAEV